VSSHALRARVLRAHERATPQGRALTGIPCPARALENRFFFRHCVVGRNFGSYVTHEVSGGAGRGAGGEGGDGARVRVCARASLAHAHPSPPLQTKNFIYFYLGQVAVLLFKSG